jgi:hypothetical protein
MRAVIGLVVVPQVFVADLPQIFFPADDLVSRDGRERRASTRGAGWGSRALLLGDNRPLRSDSPDRHRVSHTIGFNAQAQVQAVGGRSEISGASCEVKPFSVLPFLFTSMMLPGEARRALNTMCSTQ